MAKLYSRRHKCYTSSEELKITVARMEKEYFIGGAELDGEAILMRLREAIPDKENSTQCSVNFMLSYAY